MNKKPNEKSLRALVLFAIVAACAAPPIASSATTFPCPPAGGVCVVPVKVVNGNVDVADEIHVPRTAAGVNIFWELPPGFVWNLSLLDGITFKPGTPSGGQFTNPGVSQQGRRFRLLDKTTVYRTWNYTIQFHDSAGREFVKDPSIINDP